MEQADRTERAVWVSTLRDGEDTIGEVIKQTTDRKGSHWDQPTTPTSTHHQQQHRGREQHSQKGKAREDEESEQSRSSSRTRSSSASQQSRQAYRQQQPQRSKVRKDGKLERSRSPRQQSWAVTESVATETKSGAKLCPDFQKRHCAARERSEEGTALCIKGLHICGRVTANGMCGMNCHGASRCKDQRRLMPGSVATEVKRGTMPLMQLCPDFQKACCRVVKGLCPKGLHKCGRVNAKGQICGIKFHGASECDPQQQAQPGTVATHFSNGQKLCPEFQRLRCKVKKVPRCSEGLHKCGHVTTKGRICGLFFHGASTCYKK